MFDETATAMNISGYSIESEIGQGGMATVYLAVQESLRRRVALKVMSPALTGDKNFADRFLKEGQIVAQLDHPQIVTVFDFGTHQHLYYLSMEYLPGGTLEQQIRDGLSIEQSIKVIKTIAEALGYAHSQGVLHRDIKPHNILFRKDNRPVLTDFGIARFIDDTMHLTAPGLTVGSPSYMSPERISGKSIDARSDLYSLGVVFYQMLTGKLPYQADSPISVAIKHCSEPIPVLPPKFIQLQSILNKLLAKEPNDRYLNTSAFIKALEDFEAQQSSVKTIFRDSQSLPIKPDKAIHQRYKKELIIGGLLLLAGSTGIYFAVNGAFEPNPTSLGSGIDLNALPLAAEERSSFAARYEELAIETLAEGKLKQSLNLIAMGLEAVREDSRLSALQEQVQRLQKAEQLLQQARQLQQQGDLEKSLAAIEDGLKAIPQHEGLSALQEQVQRRQRAEQLLQKAQRLQQQGDLEKSLALIQVGLKEVEDHPELLALGEKVQTQLADRKQAEALLQQARQELEKRNFDESLATVEKGLQRIPDHPELLALREDVKKQIKQEQDVDRLLKQAQEQQREGALVEALVLLDGGLQRMPDHPRLLALRQAVQIDLDNQQQASEHLQQAREHYQQGDLQQSLASIEAGLEAVPDHPDLLALQEEVNAEQAQQQQARAEAQRRQETAQDLLKKAIQQQQQGQFEESLASIEAGLEAVPDHPDLLALQEEVKTKLAQQQEADELLQQAREAQQEGDLEKSLALIQEGLSLIPEQPALLSLQDEVQQQQAARQALAAALENCKDQWEAGDADPDAMAQAVTCYQDVLVQHPDNAEARQGLEQLAEQYAALSEEALAEGEGERAEEYLNPLEALDANHPALASLKQQLGSLKAEAEAEAEEQPTDAEAQLAALLVQCAEHLEANRLTTGQGGTALECYNQVLTEDPDNSDALAGLQEIAARYVGWTQIALNRNETTRAGRHLRRLAQVNPQHPRLAALQRELERVEQAAEQAAERRRQQEQAQQAALQQRQEADRLLVQAEQRYQNGALQASLNLIRQGLALAPDHEGLQALRQRVEAKLAEATEPLVLPPAPVQPSTDSEDDEPTPRKRVFGTF